jgi:hypothetical protein
MEGIGFFDFIDFIDFIDFRGARHGLPRSGILMLG